MNEQGYGHTTFREKVLVYLAVLFMPLHSLYTLLLSPFYPYLKHKTWRRVIGDASFRYVPLTLNPNQIQYVTGSSRGVYEKWAKQHAQEVVVDSIGDGAELFWIGEKSADKVVLYFHGGAYLLPISDFALSFWAYILSQLKKQHNNTRISLAALSYTLVPTADFPVQLKQGLAAVEHLLASGLHLSDILLTGDSAGAGLVLQLLSHILHPVPSVSLLSIPPDAPHRFRGVYLMSPWIALSRSRPSHITKTHNDILPPSALAFGTFVIKRVPSKFWVYLEPSYAPEGWFDGIQRVVDPENILVSAGEGECLLDDIKVLARMLGVRILLQSNGMHNELLLDFKAGEGGKGESMREVVDWIGERLTT